MVLRAYTRFQATFLTLLLVAPLIAQPSPLVRDVVNGIRDIPPFVMNHNDSASGPAQGRPWLLPEDGFYRAVYPAGLLWGAVFVTVGRSIPFQNRQERAVMDFSAYEAIVIEARGRNGGERVRVGPKTRDDPDDGSEPRALLELTRDWRVYTVQLNQFVRPGQTLPQRLANTYVAWQLVFDGATAQTVDFRRVSYSTIRPAFSSAVNAATFLSGQPGAPGGIVTFFGLKLGPPDGVICGLDANGRVTTQCGGSRVTFTVDGAAAPIPASLFFVRNDQINAQIPYEVAGRSGARVQVQAPDGSSNEQSITIDATAPGLFVLPGGNAVALNQDGRLNTSQNPASRGDVIVLYGTGEGQTEPPGVTGQLCPVTLARPLRACSASIGNQAASIVYCGCAPGFAGLLQVNARISPESETGEVPCTLTVGNSSSPSVRVWVK